MPTTTVKVEDPDPPVMGLGEKEPVVPEGKPVTFRVTFPVNPFTGDTVAVYEVVPPCMTVCEAGLAVRLKSAGLTAA